MKKEAPIKILFCVVQNEKIDITNQMLNEMGASACYTLRAQGVGHNEILNLMGLSDLECCLIISVVKTKQAETILQRLDEQLKFDKGNQGMAFSISISAISRNALTGLMEMAKQVEDINKKSEEKEDKTEKIEQNKTEKEKQDVI